MLTEDTKREMWSSMSYKIGNQIFKMITEKQVLKVVSWIAHLTAFCLFLLWGAFFIEHFKEWFFTPWPDIPPIYVWVSQFVHFIVFISYIIAMRWHVFGSILIIISSFTFLFDKVGSTFPLFFSVSIIPAVMYLFCWWRSKKYAIID